MLRHRPILLALLLIGAWLTVPVSSPGPIRQTDHCHDGPDGPIRVVWSDQAPATSPAWRQRRPGHATPGDSDGPPSICDDWALRAFLLEPGECSLVVSGRLGEPFVDGTRVTRAPPV